MTDRVKLGRNSKSRAKGYEREAAKILGGQRFPADTGKLLDVEHSYLAIQVKSGLQPARALREGLDEAQRGAPIGYLPCVVLFDRTGTTLRRTITFDLQQFADYHGLGND